MKIKISNGSSASQSDVNRLERLVGTRLPIDFVDFVSVYDGSTPESNLFSVGADNGSGVTRFIPVADIIKEAVLLTEMGEGMFPFAWAEGGNYVVIDSKSGKVFFWDHELDQPLVCISPTLSQFLDLLTPFSIESLNLKPSQARKAWIDPNFLKSIDELGGDSSRT